LQIVQPKIVICLGENAIRAIEDIGYWGADVKKLWHPAYILRKRSAIDRWWLNWVEIVATIN
jgi:hypothetical protein